MDTPKILPTNGNGSGSWENKAEQAKSGAHDTIDKVAESARPAVDKLASGAHQTLDRISDKTSQAVSALSDRVSQMKDVQDQLLAEARLRVREKPIQTLAIAAAAGFLLRHLLKSRQ